MRIVSLFSGAGGLDLGFKKAGFNIVWANEYDESIWETFRKNFPDTELDTRSITNIPSAEIPYVLGIIGGPPCQSWSEAGSGRGINDSRGKLFFEYVRVLKDKQPLFFLAENVSGILHPRHREAFFGIIQSFTDAGYNISYKLLNANDYGVPQDRLRLIIVGYHKKTGKKFEFPEPQNYKPKLRDIIWDLRYAKPAKEKNKANESRDLEFPNHEYMNGGFSTIYMSRNRVRNWDEPSFTIQAGGRHAPIHPQAPKMKFIEQNKRIFIPGKEHLYRRLSVRECARIQTFPDSFIFKYNDIADGYKMVGNAVPVEFAHRLARKIANDLKEFIPLQKYKEYKQIFQKKEKQDYAKNKNNTKVIIFDLMGVLLFPCADYQPDEMIDKIDSIIGEVTDDELFKKETIEKYNLSGEEFNIILK